MNKIKIGIIGCGNISSIYLKNCTQLFNILEVAACADILPENAKAKAEEFGVPKACSVEELLEDPEIKIVVNLTIPKVHADICIRTLEAGKNVYVEKPIAITRGDGQRILNLAKSKDLLVGGAPDTFLGAGLQTCRKLIDDGWIGAPVAATAFMMGWGPEGWHPSPEFFYQAGGGPMFDMGPYYLTALVSLLGAVNDVAGSASISFDERIITNKINWGKKINVEVPTHISGILNFKNGVIGNIITSFDVRGSKLPFAEIYGSEGTLALPDPNYFGGPVQILRKGANVWSEVPLTHCYAENSRGLGVADMAYALLSGRKHRANGELTFHVLDIMEGIHDASKDKKNYYLESTCERPTVLPLGLNQGELDF